MKTFRIHLFYLLLIALFIGGCEREGPAERAGEKLDNAVEETGEKIEETGDKIKDKTE